MGRPPLEPTSPNNTTLKLLCSYGGKILPRHPDGKLRYHGGHTRVLAVPRSVPFSELMVKMGDLCGASVSLRCQLPTEDLDALVSIKSDEDLENLIEEYDRVASPSFKIKAFLSPFRSAKSPSPSPPSSEYAASSPSPKSLSPSSSFNATGSSPRGRLSPSSSFNATASSPRFSAVPVAARPTNYGGVKVAPPLAPPQSHYGCHHCNRNPSHIYLIHNGNHWQWP